VQWFEQAATVDRYDILPCCFTCSVYCTRGQSNGIRWKPSGSLGMLSISIRFEHCSNVQTDWFIYVFCLLYCNFTDNEAHQSYNSYGE